jgi:hypothetical protein
METSPTKVKRAPTNVTGPVAWNEEVLAVFKDMGAKLGVVYAECKDHKDFLASCKALGVTRSDAMKEASRRRKEASASMSSSEEILSTPPKRKASKKAQDEQAPGAPEKLKSLPDIERLPSDTAKDLQLLADWQAEVTDAGMRYQVIKGVRYLVELATNEVITLDYVGQMGPRIGTLNEETGEIEVM